MASSSTADPAKRQLLLLVAALFVAYMCVGMSLPVTPVFANKVLGFDALWAGVAVGAAFLATILTRGHAGKLTDQAGPKKAVVRGFCFYVVSAIVSAAAGLCIQWPQAAYAVLIAGRVLLGLGESLVTVGVVTWGIGIVGLPRSATALAWIGAALYGALAIGAAVGLSLLDRAGFAGVMAVSLILPCLGLALVGRLPALPPHPGERPSLWKVVGRIWLHGLVVCGQGVGFAAIGAFFALHFLDQNWAYAGVGVTAFGAGFVLVRLLFGRTPDRFGGINVALVSLAVELVGQALIWLGPSPEVALVGAFLTGLGCSLVYPAMGREVVRIVEPHLRGTAMGGFSAFQDLAYGLTGPLAGFVADRSGYADTFLIGAVAAGMGLIIAFILKTRPPVPPGS